MRIGLVLEQFDPRRGGLEQWTARFAARLAERGHEVHVVASGFAPSTRDLPIIRHALPGVRPRLPFAEAAQAKLLTLPLDVIHDMGYGWHCDVFHPHGGSWASITQRKLLLQPRWLRPAKRGLDRWLPRQCEFRELLWRQYADHGQLLVALSQTVADDFTFFHRVPPGRIRIVYNGVDTDHFAPHNRARYRESMRRCLRIGDETLVALIVAHNFRLKGVPTLLRAMRRLKAFDAPVHLVVVGGKYLWPWRCLVRQLGLGRQVSLIGPQDDTLPYYAAADVYVHPTFYDTCSLVVLEAAASGLPIITTRLNGVSELLSDGGEGFLLNDPADAEELVERMRRMLDGPLRQRMAAAARQTALRHTLERNVAEMLGVYEEAVEAGRPAADVSRRWRRSVPGRRPAVVSATTSAGLRAASA